MIYRKSKIIIWVILYTVLSVSWIGCKKKHKDIDPIIVEIPIVKTLPVTEITDSSVVFGGVIISNGGLPITRKGIEWGMLPDITEMNCSFEDTDTFLIKLQGSFSDYYYVRAFAANIITTGYGEVLLFTNN